MTVVLAFASFVVEHWKVIALVIVVSIAGAEGWHIARKWDAEAKLISEADTIKHRLGAITLLQASDAKRAEAAEATISKLKAKARVTPANTAACLDRAAAQRVRSIAN